jgi:hypothetical protein
MMRATSEEAPHEAAIHMRVVEKYIDRKWAPPVPSVDEIALAVQIDSGLDLCELIGPNSDRGASVGRAVLVICLRDIRGMSFQEITEKMRLQGCSWIRERYHRERDAETVELIGKVYTRLGIEREDG